VFGMLSLAVAAGCPTRKFADGGDGDVARPGEGPAVAPSAPGRPLDLGAGGWLGLRWGMSPDDAAAALVREGVAFTREEHRVAIFATESGPADVPIDHLAFDREGWRVNLDFVGFRLGRISLGRQVSGAEEADRVLHDLEARYGPPGFRQDADCHLQPVRATWSAPGTQVSVNCYVMDSGWSVSQVVETVPQTPFRP